MKTTVLFEMGGFKVMSAEMNGEIGIAMSHECANGLHRNADFFSPGQIAEIISKLENLIDSHEKMKDSAKRLDEAFGASVAV